MVSLNKKWYLSSLQSDHKHIIYPFSGWTLASARRVRCQPPVPFEAEDDMFTS